METSGVVGNRVLLRLSKFTATGQLKADHSLTVKATKPQNTVEHRGKSKKGLDKRGNKSSNTVLYVFKSTMNSNNRIAATLYSLGTKFVSGI